MVLLLLCLLLFFYVAVIFARLSSRPARPRWTRIEEPETRRDASKPCRLDADCSSAERCFLLGDESFCVALLGHDCNEKTGALTLVAGPALECVCKYPHLITQKADGENCDVDVACGPHGRLEDVTVDPVLEGRCVCDGEDRVSDRSDHGPFCRAKLEKDRERCYPFPYDEATGACVCGADALDSESAEAGATFHPEYLGQFRHKCLRRPCTFDAARGRPIRHGRLVRGRHGAYCACDPRYGHYGVHLEVDAYLRNWDPNHYNACASVLGEEPDGPDVDARVYCYYYHRRRPVCFVRFANLPHAIAIEENWPDNYHQYVLRNEEVDVRTRTCQDNVFHYTCNENVVVRNKVPDCETIEFAWENTSIYSGRVGFYNTVYKYPICRYSGTEVPELTGTIIMNPLMVERTDYPQLMRSHGIVVEPGTEAWNVDFALSDFEFFKYDHYPRFEYESREVSIPFQPDLFPFPD